MSNPMIERVARAIAGSAAAAFGDRAIHYVENNWGAYTNQARAAIAALKEPSEVMLEVGGRQVGPVDSRFEGSRECIEAAWDEMLDAALKEDS